MLNNRETEKLIKNLKRNRESAYEKVLELYGDKLLKTSYLILKDLDMAEDIVQETFIKVFKNINSFKGNSSLYTWIYKIALNLCRDKLRRETELPIFDDYLEASENIEDIIINNENKEMLKKHLSNLNTIYREALILFYFEDMSIKEISVVLEEKEGTIKSRLSRGRVILREYMDKEEVK